MWKGRWRSSQKVLSRLAKGRDSTLLVLGRLAGLSEESESQVCFRK